MYWPLAPGGRAGAGAGAGGGRGHAFRCPGRLPVPG